MGRGQQTAQPILSSVILRNLIYQVVAVVAVFTQPIEGSRLAGRPDLLLIVKQVGVLIRGAGVHKNIRRAGAGRNLTVAGHSMPAMTGNESCRVLWLK